MNAKRLVILMLLVMLLTGCVASQKSVDKLSTQVANVASRPTATPMVIIFPDTPTAVTYPSPYPTATPINWAQIMEEIATMVAPTAIPPTATQDIVTSVAETVAAREVHATEIPVPSSTPVPPTQTPTQTQNPAVTPTVTSTYEVTIAGADFFAIGVEDLLEGWSRLREATNRDYCSWSSQWKLTLEGTLQAQWPHCVELRITGFGTVKFVVRPDLIGYSTSDTLGTGLAWWPSGNNGSYRVGRNGTWSNWILLSTGPEGVRFDKDGGEVTIEFQLNNGYMAMPLGEIRNNVLPKY